MYKIQVLDNISPKGLRLFESELYQLGNEFTDPDAILVRSFKLHDAVFSTNLKAVARAGAGTDNIPVELLTKRGIPVFYAPGANANAVKELVMAAMLMGYRNLSETRFFIQQLTKENKQSFNRQMETQKKKFIGREIAGKTLGVIGLGNVGVKVANAGLALGMKVLGYDSTMIVSNALELMPGVKTVIDMNYLLANSDIISLHVPLNPQTTHLINENNLNKVKDNTLLLNFSREEIVSETAVLQQIQLNKLMGYITDFPTIALAENPNVLCFPHLGASTLEAEQGSAEMVITNLRNYLERGFIEYAVNFPNLSLTVSDISDYHRILVINENIPGAMSEITQNISLLGYNIEQMENKSHGDIAVNLIDLSGSKVQIQDLVKTLAGLSKVIKCIPYNV